LRKQSLTWSKVNYHLHKRPPLIPPLDQMNPDRTLILWFFQDPF